MVAMNEAERFAVFGARKNVILPRLDAIGPQRRLDPNAPLVAAWLGNRPVVLARADPRVRPRRGLPSDLTVPLTISRFRRALDIEAGRGTMRYEPSLVDDWPLTHMPYGQIPAAQEACCKVLSYGLLAGGVAATIWAVTKLVA